jgi:hypothetical protein
MSIDASKYSADLRDVFEKISVGLSSKKAADVLRMCVRFSKEKLAYHDPNTFGKSILDVCKNFTVCYTGDVVLVEDCVKSKSTPFSDMTVDDGIDYDFIKDDNTIQWFVNGVMILPPIRALLKYPAHKGIARTKMTQKGSLMITKAYQYVLLDEFLRDVCAGAVTIATKKNTYHTQVENICIGIQKHEELYPFAEAMALSCIIRNDRSLDHWLSSMGVDMNSLTTLEFNVDDVTLMYRTSIILDLIDTIIDVNDRLSNALNSKYAEHKKALDEVYTAVVSKFRSKYGDEKIAALDLPEHSCIVSSYGLAGWKRALAQELGAELEEAKAGLKAEFKSNQDAERKSFNEEIEAKKKEAHQQMKETF